MAALVAELGAPGRVRSAVVTALRPALEPIGGLLGDDQVGNATQVDLPQARADELPQSSPDVVPPVLDFDGSDANGHYQVFLIPRRA